MKKIAAILALILANICNAMAQNYLTFTAEADNSHIRLERHGTCSPHVEYSTDGGQWTPLGAKTLNLSQKGSKVMLRGHNPEGFSRDEGQNYAQFVMDGRIKASGSIMSLIDGSGETEEIPCPFCFYHLFFHCKALTQSPEFTATILTENCYDGIFNSCVNMVKGPGELPAPVLAKKCYMGMFRGCESLTEVPEIKAHILAPYCYWYMYAYCISLQKASPMRARPIMQGSYGHMYEDCYKLTQAPKRLGKYPGKKDCCVSMFGNCHSLRKAPRMRVPQNTRQAYASDNMYRGCPKLQGHQAPKQK